MGVLSRCSLQKFSFSSLASILSLHHHLFSKIPKILPMPHVLVSRDGLMPRPQTWAAFSLTSHLTPGMPLTIGARPLVGPWSRSRTRNSWNSYSFNSSSWRAFKGHGGGGHREWTLV